MSNKKFNSIPKMGAQPKLNIQPAKVTPKWQLVVRKIYQIFELVTYWAFGIDVIILLYLMLFVWL